MTRPAWNHNLHYHPLVLDAMPAHCERALDVGCGEGTLARKLRRRAHRLTKREWHSPAPTIWPPPHMYAEVRDLAEHTLPGARYERHLLFRYSILWPAPSRAG